MASGRDIQRKGVFSFSQKGAGKVQKDVKGLAKSMTWLKRDTKGATKAGAEQSKGLLSNLSPAMKGLVKGLGAAAAAYGALEVGRKAFAAAEAAADAQNIAAAFDNLTAAQGKNADVMLESMKKATRGTITEVDLMVQTSNAAMLGVDISRMDDILEVARSTSLATGQSMSFMLQSLVTGMGRQSKLFLDNLGIIFDLDEAYSSAAESIGKTVDEMTELEKRQAFNNAALAAGADIVEGIGAEGTTAAEQFDRLRASTANLGKDLATHLVTPLAAAAGYVADIFEGISRGFEDTGRPEGGYIQLPNGVLVPKDTKILDADDPAAQRGAIGSGFGADGMFSFDRVRTKEELKAEELAAIEAKIAAYAAAAAEAMPRIAAPIMSDAGAENVFLDAVLPKPEDFMAKLEQQDEQFRGYFEGRAQAFTEDGKVNWEAYQEWMLEYIESTYGESSQGMDVLRRFNEFLADDMPTAAERGAERTAKAMAHVGFAVKATGDAFAGLIAGNKMALQEGLKIIAAEASARLLAISSEASIEALWQTAQGVGSLFWNPGKASAHFKAAGLSAATAVAAGAAAGTISRTVGPVGGSMSGGGGLSDYSRAGEAAAGRDQTGRGRESVSVTRTAPTTVNIAIYNSGPVYYASEAHVTAQALQEVMDTGDVITPEQEVA